MPCTLELPRFVWERAHTHPHHLLRLQSEPTTSRWDNILYPTLNGCITKLKTGPGSVIAYHPFIIIATLLHGLKVCNILLLKQKLVDNTYDATVQYSNGVVGQTLAGSFSWLW